MMAIQLRYLLLCVVLFNGFALKNSKAADTDPPGCGLLNSTSFDSLVPGFIFGSASAAYQVEGAWNESGRGPSMWDNFTHQYPEKIKDQSNGDVAIDQYHRYKEDVEIMKNMGLKAYRFSMSWSRLLPKGTLCDGVNPKGIEYYNNLIKELQDNGLEPFVTLFHWDVPQALVDKYGGFLSPRIVNDFQDYVDLCFSTFGDRVKHWITLNEPYTLSNHGYTIGIHAPGRCSAWFNPNCTGGDSSTEPYNVTHHQLLAHAAAVKLYKNKYQARQNGTIGITIVTHWFEPVSKAPKDIDAAFRALDFMFGWYMDPITSGDYPKSMRSLVGERLPNFTEEQSQSLKGSFDFIGLNYYSARYAIDALHDSYEHPSYLTDPHVNQASDLYGAPIGPRAASEWLYVYPKGIYDLLLYTKQKYNDPLIYITENGVDELNNPQLSLKEALDDSDRIFYYYHHLCYVEAAIKNGARVKGYFSWSVLDNFEWADGYTVRFGINYVDYKNGLTRHSKRSADWFTSFLKKNSSNTEKIRTFVDDIAWYSKFASQM